ncbi:MAG: hypothetical protein R2827_12345 [Bdellovibrionales bacterium]
MRWQKTILIFVPTGLILQNHGQTQGIDISEINSSDEMLANDGYPLGFMILADWQPPAETQLIDNLYPGFELYRDYLSLPPDERVMTDEILYWFNITN